MHDYTVLHCAQTEDRRNRVDTKCHGRIQVGCVEYLVVSNEEGPVQLLLSSLHWRQKKKVFVENHGTQLGGLCVIDVLRGDKWKLLSSA